MKARTARGSGAKAALPKREAPARIDGIDRRLVELLVRDVRTSNRVLARATGVSEWTVANRLRRLREENLLAATVVVDWERAGYRSAAFLFLRIEGGGSEALRKALAGHPSVKSVTATFGSVDLVVLLLAEEVEALRRAADEIGDLAGVASLEVAVIGEVHRIDLARMTLPIRPWSPAGLPAPAVSLDETDHRLIERLIEDGHLSNREIARQLCVSESTIRIRLRQLEDSGLLRVIAMFDPFVLGEATASYFALRTRGSSRRTVVAALARRRDVPALITCLGAHDVIGIVVSGSNREISRVLDEIRALPGVRDLVTFPIVEGVDQRIHLARLL